MKHIIRYIHIDDGKRKYTGNSIISANIQTIRYGNSEEHQRQNKIIECLLSAKMSSNANDNMKMLVNYFIAG